MTDRVKGCWVAFDKDMRVDDVEQVLSAIRMVYAGESVYDREVSKIMGKLVAERGKTGIGSTELGDRELQVLKLATQGMSNKEIGAKLCISDQTVATHFVSIFRKLAASKIS